MKYKPINSANAYLQFLSSFSLPIVVAGEKSPSKYRTGCLIDINNQLYVVSVAHGIQKGDQLIETGLTHENSAILFPCGKFEDVLDKEGLDFAWSKFPAEKIYEEVNANETLKAMKPKLIAYQQDIFEPDHKSTYCFAVYRAARVFDWGSFNKLERDLTFEIEMSYLGENDDGNYEFSLAREHQGHAFYKGCSGAPITDSQGKLCSLVIGGNQSKNTIEGLKLKSAVEKFIKIAI